MTFEEYNEKMNEYSDQLGNIYGAEFDELYQKVSNFQAKYVERCTIFGMSFK